MILRKLPFRLLALVFLIEIAAFVLLLKPFTVRQIRTQSFLGNVLYSVGGKNLLTLNSQSLTRKIESANPKIKDVVVSKSFPSTLQIDYSMRTPRLGVTDREQKVLYIADSAGVVFDEADDDDFDKFDYPLLITKRIALKNGDKLDNPAEKTAVNIINGLSESADPPRKLTVKENEVEAEWERYTVRFPSKDGIIDKLEGLQVLQKKFTIEGEWPKTIDMRYDKPVLQY